MLELREMGPFDLPNYRCCQKEPLEPLLSGRASLTSPIPETVYPSTVGALVLVGELGRKKIGSGWGC